MTYAVLRTKRHCQEWSHLGDSQPAMCCGHLAPAPLNSLPDATRSLLGATRARSCCSLLPWRTSDAQTTNCVFCVSPCKLAHRRLGDPGRQRHRHLLAAPLFAPAPTHFLALLLLALPSLARATLRLSRRCRSVSSFSSSHTRSCVKHGRKGLWFHRRCRGKWSCQKGILRRHLY